MVRVKICGVTDGADLRAVADAGADAVGVISEVSVDSPREVDLARAADLASTAPPLLTTVLVTMPDSTEDAVGAARTVTPDAVQLHGEFTPEEIGYVRAETEAKVVPVVDYDEPDRARELDEAADAVLVDSTDDDGGGGTGETGDWAAAAELRRDLVSPVILAGGLTPENVADAAATAEPFAVDVAGGVERSGGAKDHAAVSRFVRNAGRALGEAEEVYE
ncbi:N-(5'-phosphoribosyl)anthranilate isomerase [Halobacteriales archaeon QS_6_71_20]|nr:MAG: N-(5'-phosphoribosyl)anthranilate isomerase [Halobacteriales archaeon QS_6_71_20]